MRIRNTELEIVHADLTELKVDAIVHETDYRLSVVSLLSARKNIEDLLKRETIKRGFLRPGEALASRTHSLRAKYVIHAATFDSNLRTNETKIRLGCRSVLRCAEALNIKTIAFPTLGEGREKFNLVGIAKIMIQEVLKYLRETKTEISKIIFSLPTIKTYNIFKKTVSGYIGHILYKLSEGPFVTVDAIIEFKGGIVLIERSNPPYGWALPGGFVDYGESLEEAVRREVKEETGLQLFTLRQFHTYSKPDRDPRFHTIATVFIARGKGRPKFGDDAQGIKIVPHKDLRKLHYAFDHKKVIGDYLKTKKLKNH